VASACPDDSRSDEFQNVILRGGTFGSQVVRAPRPPRMLYLRFHRGDASWTEDYWYTRETAEHPAHPELGQLPVMELAPKNRWKAGQTPVLV
jgi:hypothetical protein